MTYNTIEAATKALTELIEASGRDAPPDLVDHIFNHTFNYSPARGYYKTVHGARFWTKVDLYSAASDQGKKSRSGSAGKRGPIFQSGGQTKKMPSRPRITTRQSAPKYGAL